MASYQSPQGIINLNTKNTMNLEGTKTAKNLAVAFAGEAQAYTKYQYYASKAKKDGYVQISELFEETAKNEKEHAKLWFKALHDGAKRKTHHPIQHGPGQSRNLGE